MVYSLGGARRRHDVVRVLFVLVGSRFGPVFVPPSGPRLATSLGRVESLSARGCFALGHGGVAGVCGERYS